MSGEHSIGPAPEFVRALEVSPHIPNWRVGELLRSSMARVNGYA